MLKRQNIISTYITPHASFIQRSIPFSQAKRFRRIISDYEYYEIELDKLKGYFMKTNYPSHIVDHAFLKASSLSRNVAIK